MLTLGQRTRYADALALTLFDRVRVIDAQTGHDRTYNIVAEAHIVTAGGARHSVVWTLEPAPAAAYWTVGVSPLGTATAARESTHLKPPETVREVYMHFRTCDV